MCKRIVVKQAIFPETGAMGITKV